MVQIRSRRVIVRREVIVDQQPRENEIESENLLLSYYSESLTYKGLWRDKMDRGFHGPRFIPRVPQTQDLYHEISFIRIVKLWGDEERLQRL